MGMASRELAGMGTLTVIPAHLVIGSQSVAGTVNTSIHN